jgi:Rieske Fe-S protein
MTQETLMADQITRRMTLAGAAGLTALPVLAACGGGSDGSSSASDPAASSSAGSPSASASTSAGAGGSSSAPGGDALAPTSDIPVGGGKIFSDENVVVTQPEAGTFKAFSATCTHQGCQVSEVADKTIECRCHFSKFSIVDGSVEGGPAPQPLPEVDISVANGEISLT